MNARAPINSLISHQTKRDPVNLIRWRIGRSGAVCRCFSGISKFRLKHKSNNSIKIIAQALRTIKMFINIWNNVFRDSSRRSFTIKQIRLSINFHVHKIYDFDSLYWIRGEKRGERSPDKFWIAVYVINSSKLRRSKANRSARFSPKDLINRTRIIVFQFSYEAPASHRLVARGATVDSK